ncbi:hypothetical protein, partial [Curtobacterium luteum]
LGHDRHPSSEDHVPTGQESTEPTAVPNGESVVLREDYFYSLPAPGLYDVSSDPPEATIGQLTESWDNLTTAPAADRTLNWELVWLGDVLRAIGHLLPEGKQHSTGR